MHINKLIACTESSQPWATITLTGEEIRLLRNGFSELAEESPLSPWKKRFDYDFTQLYALIEKGFIDREDLAVLNNKLAAIKESEKLF